MFSGVSKINGDSTPCVVPAGSDKNTSRALSSAMLCALGAPPFPKNVRFEPDVRVRQNAEPEPQWFEDLAEPNLEHYVRFGFEHCSQGSEPNHGQSIPQGA